MAGPAGALSRSVRPLPHRLPPAFSAELWHQSLAHQRWDNKENKIEPKAPYFPQETTKPWIDSGRNSLKDTRVKEGFQITNGYSKSVNYFSTGSNHIGKDGEQMLLQGEACVFRERKELQDCLSCWDLASEQHSLGSIISILQKCRKTKDLESAKSVHIHICNNGFDTHIDLGNHVVPTFVQCGSLSDAEQAFSKLCHPNEHSWTSLILGYIDFGQIQHAFSLYQLMREDNIHPSGHTFMALLKACAKSADIERGRQIHAVVREEGFETDLFVGSTLVAMYAKCGFLAEAQEAFDKLPVRNVVSWTALIAGYSEHDSGRKALECFDQMQLEGVAPNAITYVYSLKACSSIGAINRGYKIHTQITEKGFEKDIFIGTTLVDMYAKCGFTANAREVFDKLPVRNIVSWNALITGYIECGHSLEALNCFEWMQSEGILPNALTYVSSLKACGFLAAIKKGREIHSEIAENTFVQDTFIGTTLVDMYAKCGSLVEAQEVFDKLILQDSISWNALIAGYVENGLHQEALECLEQMQLDGVAPNSVTLIYSLKACGKLEALDKGRELHAQIAHKELESDHFVGNSLISMYVRCRALQEAREVFDRIPARDELSWSALIAGYCDQGLDQQALECFKQMIMESILPNATILSSSLKACSTIGAIIMGREVHAEIVKKGLEVDVFIGNNLIDMYAKCGSVTEACRVFDMLHSRDVISWTTVISAFVDHGAGEEALKCFEQMQQEDMVPDNITFVSSLKACGALGSIGKGKELHAQICEQGAANDPIIGAALIQMYGRCGAPLKAREVFDKLVVPDIVLWNALISAHAENGLVLEALNCFDEMQVKGVAPDATTFFYSLKACGRLGYLDKGQEIHNKMAQESYEKDTFVGNALVSMYIKCGSLSEAQKVFDTLSERDIGTWTTIIAGYAENGGGLEALKFFEMMQLQEIFPDAVVFAYILKACGDLSITVKGREVHVQVLQMGFGKDAFVGNSLVSMYSKCGSFQEAEEVFDKLIIHDTVSWNTLIAGYARNEFNLKVLKCFKEMQLEGISSSVETLVLSLRACSHLKAIEEGREIHSEIEQKGLFTVPLIGHSLIDMYTSCASLAEAQRVFDKLPHPDIVCWTSIIAGYAENGYGQAALNLFEDMQQEGMLPDAVTFLYSLKACSSIGSLDKGREIHAHIVQTQSDKNCLLGNYLVAMYSRCGSLVEARTVFDKLQARDIVSWTTLITGYAENDRGREALNCFEQMQLQCIPPNAVTFVSSLRACASVTAIEKVREVHSMIAGIGLDTDVYVCNTLVDVYAKCGSLADAQIIFDSLPVQDVVSWSTLVSGYAEHGLGEEALKCYKQMQMEGIEGNAMTFVSGLKACGIIGDIDKGREIHNKILQNGFSGGAIMSNALINMYVKCGALSEAQKVLDEIPVPNTVAWTTIIAAYADARSSPEVLNCFKQMQAEDVCPDHVMFVCSLKACGSIGAPGKGREMHAEVIQKGFERNVFVGNSLVDMYAKCGLLTEAGDAFDNLLVRDDVSWSTLIAACTENGLQKQALECYECMQFEGIFPNAAVLSCCLKACAIVGAIDKGQQLHNEIAKRGIESDIFLGTALIDMYAKCSLLQEAYMVFAKLPARSPVSWNAMIRGYGVNCEGNMAAECFEDMQVHGVEPDDITFACLLSACSRTGLIAKAKEYFYIIGKHGILPTEDHCTCMVDLLARAGHLYEAQKLIDSLCPSSQGSWSSLLSACKTFGEAELGDNCFHQLLQMNPENATAYVLMANIYAG